MGFAFLKLTLLLLLTPQGGESTATLQGTVVRAGTSEGLSKALVELYPANVGSLSDYDFNAAVLAFVKGREKTFTATTDSKGVFSLSGIPTGRYRLSATRNGFVRSEYGQRGGNDLGAIINVAGSARLSDMTVAMRPAPTISGVIHDERDRPVPFAAVLALAVEYQPGGARKYRLIQSVNSDDRGEYRLFWLTPGEYVVGVDQSEGALHEILVAAPQVNPNLARPEVDYPVHFYPNTTDIAASRPVRVQEGIDAQGIDFKIRREPMATIRGTVSPMPANARPFDVQMLLAPVAFVGRNASYRHRPNADGTFTIPGVAPGRYILQTIQPGGNRGVIKRSVAIPLDVQGQDVNRVVVSLVPKIEVQGRLRVEGAIGALPSNLAGSYVRLNDRLGSGLQIVMSPEQDGTLSAQDNGFPGDFDPMVSGLPADYYLKRVSVGQKDVLESGVHLEVGFSESIDFLLSRHDGVISGLVTNAQTQPVSAAMVVFVPEERLRGRSDRYRRVTTDSEGKYRLSSLPPGRYTALAFDEVSTNAYYNPDFLARYAARGGEVVVEENRDRTVNLRLIPAEH
jgi:hypothetical protein